MTDYKALAKDARKRGTENLTHEEIAALTYALEACDRERQEAVAQRDEYGRDQYQQGVEDTEALAQTYREALERITQQEDAYPEGCSCGHTIRMCHRWNAAAWCGGSGAQALARAALAAGDSRKQGDPDKETQPVIDPEFRRVGDMEKSAAKSLITIHKELTNLRKVALSKTEAQSLLDALDTLDGAGITAVTGDLEILEKAKHKLQKIMNEK